MTNNHKNEFLLSKITSKIGSGATPRGGNSVYKENGISFIRSQNIYDFHFSKGNLAFIDEQQAEKLDNVEVKKDDVLLNITGDSIARVCMVPEDILPARVNQHVSIIRSKGKIDSRYIMYYLINLKPYLLQICKVGGTRNALTKDSISNLPIRILPSHRSLSHLLSTLDAKIHLNNQVNAELEKLAKTIYNYWFVQFDFPDAQGRPYKSSGGEMVYDARLGREIPVGWGAGDMTALGKIVGGSTPSRSNPLYFKNGTIPWITPKDLSLNKGKKFISSGEVSITQAGLESASLKKLPRGSVLMSSRAPVGYLAIAQQDLTTNQGFKSFVPKKPYSTNFIYYTLQCYMPVIEQNATGSTFKEISGSVLKSIVIPAPQKMLVEKFSYTTSTIFTKQELLEQQNAHLTTLRDWLLPLLMNGQVGVKD